MDTRLLLVKTITLMFCESLIPDKTENSSDLVRTVLEAIKLPELSITLSHEREHLNAVKETALYMCSCPVNEEHSADELLQRLKVNCNSDEKLYEAFAQGIEKERDESSLKRTVLNIRKYINDAFRENEIITLMGKAYKDLNFNRDKIKDIRAYVRDLSVKLEPYQIEASRKDPAIIGAVDLGDTSNLSEAFEEVQSMEDATGLLVTGWQGLNTVLQGGFRRGEQWVLPALQHKYKTGFSLTLFKQIAIYNVPKMINPAKKPLLLRISFEDALYTNLKFLYQNFYENEHSKEACLKDVTPAQMAAYVKEKMQVTGYHVKMMRVNPSEWTYKDIQNTVLEMEANGYEVHLLMLDYLPMLPTTGCEQGPTGTDLQDMYRRMRNFCSARKITMLTPHQLSTDAKQLVRDGHTDFVKLLPGRGYYKGSKQIDQEVDGELYLHIEKLNGKSYLTVQRGKHRGVGIIPEDDMYFVLPFVGKMSIADDLNKAPITLSKVGGQPAGAAAGAEAEFWSYN